MSLLGIPVFCVLLGLAELYEKYPILIYLHMALVLMGVLASCIPGIIQLDVLSISLFLGVLTCIVSIQIIIFKYWRPHFALWVPTGVLAVYCLIALGYHIQKDAVFVLFVSFAASLAAAAYYTVIHFFGEKDGKGECEVCSFF